MKYILKGIAMLYLLRYKHIFLFASILFFILASIMTFIHINTKKSEVYKYHEVARTETNRAVDYVSNKLKMLKTIATSLEKVLHNNGAIHSEKLEALLMEKAVENPKIFGIGVAYNPYAFDIDKKLYAPYVRHKEGVPELIHVEDIYDYTKPAHQWFSLPLKKGGMWQEPYYGEASKRMLAEYTFPIYRHDENNKSTVGVGYVNHTLEEMRGFLSTLELGKSGYGVILSKEGYIISHPDEKLVKRKTHLETVAKEQNDKEMIRLIELMRIQKTGDLSLLEMATGRKAWVFFKPIPEAGWTFLSVIFEEPTHEAAQKLHRQMIIISLLFLILSGIIPRPLGRNLMI
ncbi:MAG: hypothetical protein U9O64_01110 [Campylobacterota bacterium]|nr:hypothetical protein [Campylobacterota bacterium]